MDERKRRLNEKNFTFWEEIPDGGRRYWYEVPARHHGWKARYVKEVDANETTTRFYQEIYNDKGELVEIHQKYPFDTGHRKLKI